MYIFLKFFEEIPVTRLKMIIVTYLDDESASDVHEVFEAEAFTLLALFDDLGMIISEKNDGSINHDKYIYSKENL